MRIELTKSNPNHDERGRFAAADARLEAAGFKTRIRPTPRETARSLAAEYKDPANKDKFHPIAAMNVMAHAYDMSFKDARKHLDEFGHKHGKGGFGKDKNVYNTSKPSSAAFKKAHDHSNFAHKGVATPIREFHQKVLAKEHVAHLDASYKAYQYQFYGEHSTLKKEDFKYLDRVAHDARPYYSASPASVEVALHSADTFNKAWGTFDQKGRQALHAAGKSPSLDHIVPKGWFITRTKADAEWINGAHNFKWLSKQDNSAKRDFLVNKKTGKRFFDKIHPKALDLLSGEALWTLHMHEKHNNHEFIKGRPITKEDVSRAFKEGRSRAKYLKDNFLDTKVSLPAHSAPSIMRRLGQERAAKEKERRFKEYEAAVKRSVKQGVKPPKKPRGYRPTNKE